MRDIEAAKVAPPCLEPFTMDSAMIINVSCYRIVAKTVNGWSLKYRLLAAALIAFGSNGVLSPSVQSSKRGRYSKMA